MKKRKRLALALSLMALPLMAQQKINPYSLKTIHEMRTTAAGNTLSLSTASLPRGIYTIKMFDGQTTHIVKVVQP